MLFATADSTSQAIEFSQKQLDYAANVSFAAYCLVFLACAVLGLILLHILCFVRPDAKNRRECNTKIADAVQTFATNDAAKVQILDEIKDWHRSHDTRLSGIREVASKSHCEAAELIRKQTAPHGA